MPRFTIISTTYKVGDAIDRTFDSLKAQSFRDFEYIIVDGGSDAGFVDKLAAWAQASPWFRYVSEPDRGIYDAMNKGVRLAKGDYILFLGAGDCLYDGQVLAEAAKALSGEEPDVLYGQAIIVKMDGTRKRNIRHINRSYRFRADPVIHQAIFGKRVLLEEYPFDEKYRIASDQDWVMKMYKQDRSFRYIDIPVAYFFSGGLSTNPKSNEACLKELRRIHKSYYPGWYALHTVLRIINKHLLHIKRYKNDEILRQ